MIVGQDLRDEFNIGVTPFALLIDRNGVVLASGLVNTLEHVESLISAGDRVEHLPLPTFSSTDSSDNDRVPL